MKNKLKEKMTIGKAKKILRGFLAKDCYYDTPLYYAIPYLLDYITNLQQENENLKDFNNKLQATKDRLDKYDRENQLEIDRLNNIINELEKTIENRLMAVPDDVLDDGIEEIKRTTKIAVYQVILGDLYKLKELKENK